MNASLELAINLYTAGVTRARNDYAKHPFAATHVSRCQGTCGGWVALSRNTPDIPLCTPCADRGQIRLPPVKPTRAAKPCGYCGNPMAGLPPRRKYCCQSCAASASNTARWKATR